MGGQRVIKHLIIRGRVQGVGFRAFVAHHAIQHNLAGWVRNRRDGTVEAMFSGPADLVDEMIRACRTGPPSGRVDSIDQRDGAEAELPVRAPGEKFVCLPTA